MDVDRIQRIEGFEAFCEAAEMLPWATCVIDAEYQTRFSNTRFQKLLPTPPEGPLDLCFLSPERDLFRRFVEHQFQNGEDICPGTALRCHLCRDNKRISVEIEACPVRKEVTPLLALFIKDLTIDRRRRRRKQDRKRHYQSILENSGAVVYIKDAQGRYLFVNHLFETLFHVRNQQIRGKSDYEIFNDHIAGQFRKVDQQVIKTGKMLRLQEVATHEDGLHTYISVKFPLLDAQGKITGLAGISTDITDQFHAQQEIFAAQAVQELLYPRTEPQYPGYDMSGLVSPANIVSGDYYDYIWLSPSRLVIAVGDVSGHGLGPALEMVETRAYLRAILRTEVRLDVTMECLNEFLYRDLRDSAFVTLFLVDLDLAANTFHYVGAGHRGDFLRADGTNLELISTGLILGIDSPVSYTCSPVYSFEPGDVLLLSTDGVTEAVNSSGEIYGQERLLEEVRGQSHLPARDIVAHLIGSARNTTGGRSQADDMTVVVIKRGATQV